MFCSVCVEADSSGTIIANQERCVTKCMMTKQRHDRRANRQRRGLLLHACMHACILSHFLKLPSGRKGSTLPRSWHHVSIVMAGVSQIHRKHHTSSMLPACLEPRKRTIHHHDAYVYILIKEAIYGRKVFYAHLGYM